MKETGVNYSTNYQKESNPDHVKASADDTIMFHNTQNIAGYSFTKNEVEMKETVLPYVVKKSSTFKKENSSEDGESTDSNFCASSIHESQSSRKSLTKK